MRLLRNLKINVWVVKMHDLNYYYRKLGGIAGAFEREDFVYLMVHGNEVIKSQTLEGLSIKCDSVEEGVNLQFCLAEGYQISNPVMVCFGILPAEGIQRINVKGILQKGSSMEFMAYCIFPNGKKIQHYMEGDIDVGEDASFRYSEIHYHGENGGVEIYPNMKVNIRRGGSFLSKFKLSEGRAGKIKLTYDIKSGEESKVELIAKALASKDDEVYIKENLSLEGKNSRGNIASYLVGKDHSKMEIYNKIIAKAPGCKGHIDCIETILDSAQAVAVPLVDVRDASAQVTHEAAIGSINKKQLEVLMSKGLSKNEATEIILKGLLK